jgi:type I restriction enzyme, S subunit
VADAPIQHMEGRMMRHLMPYPRMKDSGVPWLGAVPEHWDVRRLKALCVMKSGDGITAPAIEPIGEFPVFGGNGIRGYTSRYNQDGTFVLIGRQGALCGNIRIARGQFWASEHAVVATLRPGHVVEWFSGALEAMNLRQYSIAAAQPGLAVERILDLSLAVPPPAEQRAVARFLHHADRRIRHYIRAKQKLIKLLEEQRQVVIHRAVTRGFDPTARLEPSGVTWLGDVPEHWEIWRSKRLFSIRSELARPDDIQLSSSQLYGVIPQHEYERRVGRKVVRILHHLDKRRHVEVGDFVISMRSFQGGLERAWAAGCIRSSYVVLQPARRVDVDFFTHVFKSPGYIRALQATANFIRDGQDLTFENFSAVDLAVPPIEEQRLIASRVGDSIASTWEAIERARKEIELLREYRTRLIADVVTGKLDVREAAARLPDEPEGEELSDDADDLTDTEESTTDDLDAVPQGTDA